MASLNETLLDSKKIELSREILRFLKDGEENLVLGKFKQATLIVGVTGSGKSSLTQFITGNDEGLTAEETGDDTGEFTITDKNENVCDSTITSCTIIPTLYVDKKTQSGFYDCSGFGDTRDAKHDISVTYFIKKIVDSVDAVKLVFTVNYSSVRKGVDRRDFLFLVKNILNMVKDVEKFDDGIALVVTKVENRFVNKKGKWTMVSDETVIDNIAAFLSDAKDSLSASMFEGDSAFYKKATKFIDILLKRNGDEYTRIGLFRRPNEAGKLGEIDVLKSGKERLDVIFQSLRYVPKTAEDFGYTLSPESLNHMHALIYSIDEDLAGSFQSLLAPLEEHYQGKVSPDVERLSEHLVHVHDQLLNLKTTSSPIAVMNEIVALADMENVSLPTDVKQKVVHCDEFLRFVKLISGKKSSPLVWQQGFNQAVENLQASQNWFDMLVNLKNALYKYDVLMRVKKNSLTEDLRKEISNYAESGSEEQSASLLFLFSSFLREVFKDDYDREYRKINNVSVSGDKWRILNTLLDFTLQSSCGATEAESSVLSGHYVALSDLKEMECANKGKVHVVAQRKVFIDEHYVKIGGEAELVIIAPSWEVVGSPKIILDGVKGEGHNPEKADNGGGYRKNGRNGEDGKDGGPGGSFVGVGQSCINCHRLTVSANGGSGGDGQSGGDGAAGEDHHHTHSKGGSYFNILIYSSESSEKVHEGQRGGDGGNGGSGGFGGPAGSAWFVMFDQTEPKISASPGVGGQGGEGGKPGRGGKSTKIIKDSTSFLFFLTPSAKNYAYNAPPAPDGSRGRNGESPKNLPSVPEDDDSCEIPSQNYSKLFHLLGEPLDKTSRLFMANLKMPIDLEPSTLIEGGAQTPGQSQPMNISDVHSNLLFLHYLAGMKGKSHCHRKRNHMMEDDYAHNMAYSAYRPQNS